MGKGLISAVQPITCGCGRKERKIFEIDTPKKMSSFLQLLFMFWLVCLLIPHLCTCFLFFAVSFSICLLFLSVLLVLLEFISL